MDRVKPYSGTSDIRLSDLIKASNPKLNRPDVSFEFGTPVAVTGWLNTTLFARPVVRSLLQEPPVSTVTPPPPVPAPMPALFEEIKYRRLSLEVLKMLPECEIFPVENVTLPFSIHDILPQINEALGLDLQPSEVVNHRYENAALTYKLEISGNTCLAWTNSFYMFDTNLGYGTNTRLMEDGSIRENESGAARVVEG